MKGLLAAAASMLALTGAAAGTTKSAAAPRVWFAPLPPDLPGHTGGGSRDYMALFSRRAKWKLAARHVRVFKIYSGWATDIARFSELKRLVVDLRRRKIALAAEVPALVSTGVCGNGIEGFAGPHDATRLALTIKAAGGKLSYVAFDEPFAFGHLYDGPNACGWSAEKIASDVSAYVNELREWFPHVVAGDIEPLWGGQGPGTFEDWLDTYARVTGTRLPFFDLDVDFNRLDWVESTKELESFTRGRGTRFGLIYIGAGGTDVAWAQSAEDREAMYEATTGLRPDDVIFQSWLDYPHHVLPETKRGTFTWLIDRYFRPRTSLLLVADRETATATLTDGRGGVLAGQAVELAATAVDGPGNDSAYTISGTVPVNASTAVVGFRVNTECGCSGASDFTLYDVTYTESDGVNRVPNAHFDAGLQGWGVWGDGEMQVESTSRGPALHVVAAPDQVAASNSTEFAVGGGQRFTLAFDGRVTPKSIGSGYFDIVFLSGTEVMRTTIKIAAARVRLGVATTDGRGAAEASTADLPSGSYAVEAWFRGDNRRFPAYASTTISRP